MKKRNRKNRFVFVIFMLLILNLNNNSYATVESISCTNLTNSKMISVTNNKEELKIKSTARAIINYQYYTIESNVDTYQIQFKIEVEQGLFTGGFEEPELEFDKNKMEIEATLKDKEYSWINSCNMIVKVKFKKMGAHEFKVTLRSDSYNNAEFEVVTVRIKNVTQSTEEIEKAEEEKKKAEEQNEALETFYKKNISELTTADYKLKYLRSILYNDNLNKNTALWDKFVSETTPEQRKAWKKDITLNWRDSDPEYQSAIDALGKQIEVDEGTATESELNNSMNEARTISTRDT